MALLIVDVGGSISIIPVVDMSGSRPMLEQPNEGVVEVPVRVVKSDEVETVREVD